MSRVPRTLLALDIGFLSGYAYVLNDPEVTIPSQILFAAAERCRGSPLLSAVS